MRFLLDQGLARSAMPLLISKGYDSVHVGELGVSRSPDTDTIARAGAERRIALTLDADFHTLISLSGHSGPSCVRIRIEGLQAPALVDLLVQAVRSFSQELIDGSLVTIDERSIRVRRLPLR